MSIALLPPKSTASQHITAFGLQVVELRLACYALPKISPNFTYVDVLPPVALGT
jgi:hypothetical protein